eukprot:15048-Heterococcus_DN1.PRE.5
MQQLRLPREEYLFNITGTAVEEASMWHVTSQHWLFSGLAFGPNATLEELRLSKANSAQGRRKLFKANTHCACAENICSSTLAL